MNIHNRHSIRLKGYDYSQEGAYFVTICTRNGEMYFEKYKELKEIINHRWNEIPSLYPNIELDEFVIMPNHLHGIIIIGAGARNGIGAKPGAGARLPLRWGKLLANLNRYVLTIGWNI